MKVLAVAAQEYSSPFSPKVNKALEKCAVLVHTTVAKAFGFALIGYLVRPIFPSLFPPMICVSAAVLVTSAAIELGKRYEISWITNVQKDKRLFSSQIQNAHFISAIACPLFAKLSTVVSCILAIGIGTYTALIFERKQYLRDLNKNKDESVDHPLHRLGT